MMKKLTRITAIIVVGVIMLMSTAALSAQNEERASFSIEVIGREGQERQPYFTFEAHGNTVIDGLAVVKNRGRAAGTARIYAVDATTEARGGVAYGMYQDKPANVGAWVQLETDSVTLAPGENQIVSFQVSVPAGARVGDHVGGLVVENIDGGTVQQADNGRREATFHVKLQTRSVVAVQVTVPGESVEQIDVLGLTPGGQNGYQILHLNLRNSGNRMVKSRGTLLVRDADGQRVQQLRFDVNTFLPETTIAYPLYVEKQALEAGSYTADLALRYGDTRQITQQQLSFTISEALNMQVFEGREALSSPVAEAANELVGGRPVWQIFVLGGLGFLNIGLVLFLAVSGYQYYQTRQRRKKVSSRRAPQRQRPLPQTMPRNSRS